MSPVPETGLDALRQVKRALVLKAGIPAARLDRQNNAIVFSYLPDYRARGGPPVATSLPLSESTPVIQGGSALPPFFSGLLPEGRRLTALRTAVKTSADDEFTLLLAVGTDVVGDVQVIPEDQDALSGAAVPAAAPQIEVQRWNEARFADLFSASISAGGAVDRVGIPGVQDKVSARMINVPVARQGERYILKLDPPEFPHLVANEAFFLKAARRSGIETVEARVVRDADDRPGLLVRRLDRGVDASGALVSRAQEDACQVLKRFPADKYRVTTEEVIEALASVCQARPVAALTLLRQVAFAYLTCNGDAHAKNFSVGQLSSGEWRVCPAYDLPSSYPYGDTSMALSVNGQTRENIARRDFLAAGQAVGLRVPAVARMLDHLAHAVDGWIEDLVALPFDSGKLAKLRRAIEYRRNQIAGASASTP